MVAKVTFYRQVKTGQAIHQGIAVSKLYSQDKTEVTESRESNKYSQERPKDRFSFLVNPQEVGPLLEKQEDTSTKTELTEVRVKESKTEDNPNLWKLEYYLPQVNPTTSSSTRSNYQDAAEEISEGKSTTKEEYPFVDQGQDTFSYKRNVKEPKQVTIKAEQDIIMSDPDQTAARALAQVEALQKELESHLPDTLQEIKNSHSGTQQQVNEISSSLALLVTQMHQLSNSMEVVTQSMSHKEGSKGKDPALRRRKTRGDTNDGRTPRGDPNDPGSSSSSSSDDQSSDEESLTEQDVTSSEDDQDSDGIQEPHSGRRGFKHKFKVPEEKYSGEPKKVEPWLFNLEEYFDKARTSKKEQVPIATSNLVGDATLWWRTLRKSKEAPKSWSRFKAAFRERFLPLNVYKTNRDRLQELKQLSSVAKYNTAFQAAYVECTDVSEAEARARYIDGLKGKTRAYVTLAEPKTIRTAMKIAEKYDDAIFPKVPYRNRSDTGGSQASQRSYYKKHHSKHNTHRSKNPQDNHMDIDQAERGQTRKYSFEEAKKLGVCMGCGNKGHVWRKCPTNPKVSKN